MPKYRKKPVVIDALLWTGDNWDEVCDWAIDLNPKADLIRHQNHKLEIHTLEGVMTASPGDYIICGIKREFYPCKPDIFLETNEGLDAVQPLSVANHRLIEMCEGLLLRLTTAAELIESMAEDEEDDREAKEYIAETRAELNRIKGVK